MGAGLPISIMEPLPERKQLAVAQILKQGRDTLAAVQTADPSAAKGRLREIRRYAADHLPLLLERLRQTLAARYPGLRVKFAATAHEAVDYVRSVSRGTTVLTNNSAVVSRELKPGLLAAGFRVINSYAYEFETKQKGIADYWDLPRLLDRNLAVRFDVSRRMAGLEEAEVIREYTALLGVNALAAEDGSVFFLQHFTNITRDLHEAREVVLVAGLDKIVKDAEDALFQTQCMGIFGAESMLFEVQPGAGQKTGEAPGELPASPPGVARGLHLILLDNGRHDLLAGKYRDLFLCIGCRACNQRCPVRHSFAGADYVWTPRNYLKQFLDGKSSSIDTCLHCEGCRLACPLEIDLPHLMWEAKLDYVAKHRVSLGHMVLGRPELIARAGSMAAPLANAALRVGPLRRVMELVPGIHREVRMPAFHRETFAAWFARYGRKGQ